jgi:DNA-binding transcriptional LysR family regulator
MARAVNLAAIDLNLLTAFRALEEARNVTRAARTLGLSQPALSHALSRLRELFEDPLFIKAPRGISPTPRAEELTGPIREVLGVIERRVLARGPFSPRELRRDFRLRTTDYVEALYAPRLTQILAREAPSVRFASMPIGFELPTSDLAGGACDLAIAGFFGALPRGFYELPLFEDTFASAVHRTHPRLGTRRRVSLEAFVAERHLLVAPSGDLVGAVDRALARSGKERTIAAGLSGFLVAGLVTLESDGILTAPSRILSTMAGLLPLHVFATPLELSPIRIVAAWHERSHHDPGHAWFRALLADCLKPARPAPPATPATQRGRRRA